MICHFKVVSILCGLLMHAATKKNLILDYANIYFEYPESLQTMQLEEKQADSPFILQFLITHIAISNVSMNPPTIHWQKFNVVIMN